MLISELIKTVIDEIPEYLNVGITFDIGIEADGKTINECSLNRIKFSIKKKIPWI